MAGHDPILLLLIIILGVLCLVVARRKLQQLKPKDPTWDMEKLRKMRRHEMQECVYCEERDTSNRDDDGDPMCLVCEQTLFP